MATPKNRPAKDVEFNFMDSLNKMKAEAEALPLLATRTWVEEVCDSYYDWDDVYCTKKSRPASPYFYSTKCYDVDQAALDWIAEHDPDDWDGRPTTFQTRKQYLRTHTENKWGYL